MTPPSRAPGLSLAKDFHEFLVSSVFRGLLQLPGFLDHRGQRIVSAEVVWGRRALRAPSILSFQGEPIGGFESLAPRPRARACPQPAEPELAPLERVLSKALAISLGSFSEIHFAHFAAFALSMKQSGSATIRLNFWHSLVLRCQSESTGVAAEQPVSGSAVDSRDISLHIV